MKSKDQPRVPYWISDVESKDYLRSRKLAGYWTLTIDVHMLTKDVFASTSPAYDDGSHFSQLSFFRIDHECAALEWESKTLKCRIWILVREITPLEIESRVRSLRDTFLSYLDFRHAKLILESEPNELTLVGSDPAHLAELRELVAKCEQQLNCFSIEPG